MTGINLSSACNKPSPAFFGLRSFYNKKPITDDLTIPAISRFLYFYQDTYTWRDLLGPQRFELGHTTLSWQLLILWNETMQPRDPPKYAACSHAAILCLTSGIASSASNFPGNLWNLFPGNLWSFPGNSREFPGNIILIKTPILMLYFPDFLVSNNQPCNSSIQIQ